MMRAAAGWMVCAFAVLAGAEAPALQLQAPQQPQRPVFRSDAHFVLVDAYPLRDGKVVEGMTAADFVVREDGVPQKVELFEFVGGGAAEPESARRDPNTVAASREAAADPRARTFVAYLDIPHVSNAGAHRARMPLVEMLNRIITPNDLFGVISSEHDVTSLTFGRRITSIDDQLARYWAWGLRDSFMRTADEDGLQSCFSHTSGAVPKERFVQDGGTLRALPAVLIERHRADRILTHLEDLVWYMGRLREGRTSVVLFTEGWRLYPRDTVLKAEVENTANEMPGAGTSGSQFVMFSTVAQGQRQACIQEAIRLADVDFAGRQRELIRLANSMNVSFFAVNPMGLVSIDRNIGENAHVVDPLTAASDDWNRLNERREGLLALSENTDGAAAVSTNDMRDALRPVMDQLRAFYLLGYYSSNTRFDGQIRQISVSSSLGDVTVKARRSYRAPTPEERTLRANPVAAPALTELDKALDVLAGIRSADDRSFNAARYLKADAAPMLGAPAVFRATPSPRSPMVPVTAPAFRRTERIRVEWPITQALDTRTARVVGRDGKPLAAQVAVSERTTDVSSLVVDVVLGALAPGDYAVDLVVTSRGETKRTYLPFKVVP
jgi:VWFA-related protein